MPRLSMLFIIELLLKFRFMIVLLNLISFLTIYSLAGLHFFLLSFNKGNPFLASTQPVSAQ